MSTAAGMMSTSSGRKWSPGRACLWPLLFLALTNGCASAHINRAAEEAAVRRAWQEVSDAFMAADWDRYSELWVQSEDLQVVHPGQRDWLSGWAAFADRYRDLIAEGDRWNFETTRLHVQVDSTGDTAWAIGELQLGFGERAQPAWQMAVFRKQQGRWKIAAAFSSLLPPEPPKGGGTESDGK